MVTLVNPIFDRRSLSRRLRRAREARSLRQTDVAKAMGWSESKVIRIERALVGISNKDLTKLLVLYGITDPDVVAELFATWKASRRPPWWNEYIDLVDTEFGHFLGYESSTSQLLKFSVAVLPGLLQTRDYAAAILKNFAAAADVPRLVELRMRRKSTLDRENPPIAKFVLSEATLRTVVGTHETMKEQLEHLLWWLQHPNVDIGIIPFTEGAHPGMIGSFELMVFDEDEGTIAYFESPRGLIVLKEETEVIEDYKEMFDYLCTIALMGEKAATFIKQVIDDLTLKIQDQGAAQV